MPRSQKSTKERMAELDAQLAKAQEKARQIEARKKKLEKQANEEKRKADTHRKIEVGATVESICHIAIEKEDLPRLISFFMKMERDNNHYFSRHMGYDVEEKEENGKKMFIYSKKERQDRSQEAVQE